VGHSNRGPGSEQALPPSQVISSTTSAFAGGRKVGHAVVRSVVGLVALSMPKQIRDDDPEPIFEDTYVPPYEPAVTPHGESMQQDNGRTLAPNFVTDAESPTVHEHASFQNLQGMCLDLTNRAYPDHVIVDLARRAAR
jgi:hypothetical protein